MPTSALAPPAVTPAPIAPRERIGLIDALRGFALFGVLMGNLAPNTGWYDLDPARQAAQFGGHATKTAIEFFIDGRFYSIFSLLFGLGFAMQLGRIEASGEGIGRYSRRLAVLLGFGLAHLIFLWMGDILALYAMLGFGLLLFRRTPDRRLLVWAAALTIIPVAWQAAIWLSGGAFRPWGPFQAAAFSTYQALIGPPPHSMTEAWLVSDYGTMLRSHLAEIFIRYGDLVGEMRFTKVFALFLVGLWVGRGSLATAPDAHAPLLRRVCVWGFAVGLPASAALVWCTSREFADPAAWPNSYTVVAALFYALGVPTMALAYTAGFALLWRRSAARRLLGIFAPAGRMALTNYLLQSVISLLIFTGVGLGLMGRTQMVWVPVLTVAILAVQVWLSRWWLARYRFGPAEWLWRTLTYGRAQPMRRPVLEPEEAAVPALTG